MKTEVQIRKSEEKLKIQFLESKERKSRNIKKSIEDIDKKILVLQAQRQRLVDAFHENEKREFVSLIPSTDQRIRQAEESKLRELGSSVNQQETVNGLTDSNQTQVRVFRDLQV